MIGNEPTAKTMPKSAVTVNNRRRHCLQRGWRGAGRGRSIPDCSTSFIFLAGGKNVGRFDQSIPMPLDKCCHRVGEKLDSVRFQETDFPKSEWRIGVESLELFRVIRRSVIRDPVPPDRELVEPQHVHDADLQDRRADEQPAVRSTLHGELRRRGVFIRDQPFGGRNKIVKDVLLLYEKSSALVIRDVGLIPIVPPPMLGNNLDPWIDILICLDHLL
jgi:hypothetical protein